MAATAYACLVSFLNTMDQIHAHPLVSTFFDIDQIKTLPEKVNFLLGFVEEYSDADSREVEDLVRQIADAAHEAEDIIEVYVANRVRGEECPSFLPDLQIIIEKMESIKEVIKIKEEAGKSWRFLPDPPPSLSSPSSSSAPPATDEATTIVGFDDHLREVWDELHGPDLDRKIISITGMGGIGKTTLARNLYEDSRVVRNFGLRAWVTVSQDSNVRKVYLQALSCLGGGSISTKETDEKLSERLYKTLFHRKYLIILDDVWSVEIVNKINFFFPENRNGSRIIVTTREAKLFDYIGSLPIAVKLLDEDKSWKLFCERTFPQQDFPLELERVGKKIVKKCGGLPLAINVMGGLLAKSHGMQKYWEQVARDISLILNSAENKVSDILYLSYKYLSIHLKPCFLYLGLYPEDALIDVSQLIKFWIAEGFIKSKRGQSLEEVAESYVSDLVDRNLLLLDTYSTGSSKSISTHDLIRDLCIKISEQENFYCVQRSIDGNHHIIANKVMTRFYPDQESYAYQTPSILDPLIVPVSEGAGQFKTRLCRVLCCGSWIPYDDALEEVNIRFLQDCFLQDWFSKVERDYLLASSVSRLWGLQTIIVEARDFVVAPVEIWKMQQLRHINFLGISLPVPPPHPDDSVCVLQNLQTLKGVQNLIFTEEVCKRIPNIKQLHIKYEVWLQSEACQSYHLENLDCFNKLESLDYECEHADDSLRNIRFPSSLKMLTLMNCRLDWSYMAMIASLPYLEFLTIKTNAVAATEWLFTDENFSSLKCLDIVFCNHVTKWIAESSNFPVLEKLRIWNLYELKEIPSGIGEIPTLQSLALENCSKSANISAVKILLEQQMYDNLRLRVDIQTREAESLKEKVQQLSSTCQNLNIRCDHINLSSSLKELTLSDCVLEWSNIAAIPHLQRLTLGHEAIATEWILVDEEFVSLMYLRLTSCRRMTKWIAESSNFPVLKKLFIADLPQLDVIPSGIGEIPTLGEITLYHCSESANISAVEILHEQQMYENLGLKVFIEHNDAARLRQLIPELGLTCQNLEIYCESHLISRN